jgi:hypothetical protein
MSTNTCDLAEYSIGQTRGEIPYAPPVPLVIIDLVLIDMAEVGGLIDNHNTTPNIQARRHHI